MRRKLMTALVLLFLPLGFVSAQRFTEDVQVTLIEVPVTVADKAGNPVRGLIKEDFELFDDGKRVPIEYFDVVDLNSVAPAESKALPPAAYRNFLLLFDLANSNPGTIGRAQAAAREFVTSQLTQRDLIAVATYTASNGLELHTSFTSDRRLIASAIDTLGQTGTFKVPDPLRIAAGAEGGGGLQAAGRKADSADVQAEQREYTRMSTAAHENEMRTRVRSQLSNFGNIARLLDRLHGQKQIILLSEGIDARLLTGRQDLSFKGTQEENDAVSRGEVWKVDSEARFGSASGIAEVNDMSELFRRSDVRMHAIDIKGVRSDVDAREGLQRSSNEGLFLLTRPTGGTVFQNANDMKSNFDSLLKRQEVIYLLGFTSKGSGKPGKFHSIKVKSNKRGAELTHRAGYYEPSSKVHELERTLSLAEILVTDIPVEDVPITLVSAAAPGPNGLARVPVVVEIPGTQLLEGITGGSVNANLFIYAFDEQRQVVDFMQQRIGFDLAKAGETLRNSGIRYIGALRLPPGQYAVKALIRVDETGRIGFLRSDLTVPTFKDKTVLAPLALGDASKGITLISPTRGEEAKLVLSLAGQPLVPRTHTSLAAGALQRVALLLYRMPPDDLAVTPSIMASNGVSSDAKVALVGRTSADPDGISKLVFDFRPEGLVRGDYELRFTVTPKGGTSSMVALPFVIQ